MDLLKNDNPKIMAVSRIDLVLTIKNIKSFTKNKKIMVYESEIGNPIPKISGYNQIQSLNYLFTEISNLFYFNQINIFGAEL